MFFYIVLGFFNCFFDSQSVQGEVTVRSDVRTRRVADDTFFGVETFFADNCIVGANGSEKSKQSKIGS